ncbi:MAG TPA: two-component system response regulator RppA [Halomicronema sp.]
MKILLVDDEVELTDPVSRVLQRESYQVDVAYDGEKGSELAAKTDYNLLILDWMLPKQTGLEICQKLRAEGRLTPVLFLTAKDTIDDRVRGLDAGADDYLVKPFELRELLARVRALLRRGMALESGILTEPEKPILLRVGDLELDTENKLAYRQGRLIQLSEKESQLLEYLMRHAGQLLSHTQIYKHLWGTDEEPPSSNVLAAQIRLLRRKIEAQGDAPLIHSVYGKGYRFAGVGE